MNNRKFNEALRIWIVPFGLCWLVVSMAILLLVPLPPDSLQEKLFIIGVGGVSLFALCASIFQYERIKKLKVRRIVKYGVRILLVAYLIATLFMLIEIMQFSQAV